jgi:hypothetical protein
MDISEHPIHNMRIRPRYRAILLYSYSVADPGSGAFLTPGSRIFILDHISERSETIFWLKTLKFFDADPGSVIFLTLDPGRKNSDL